MMTLVKYRDAGMNTYTYFWKNEKNQTISPYLDSEKEATDWLAQHEQSVKDCEAK